MLLQALREAVAAYGRRLLGEGLTMHTGGNLSARDGESGLIAIKPSGVPYDAIRPQDVAVIDLDGRLVEGSLPPSSEWPMHAAIYRAHPRAGGVVHCHSPLASAMAAAGREIPLVSHEICLHCTTPVRIAPFAVPGTEALADRALEGLGADNNIVLLESHGTVAMGASLWHAYDAACAAELTAQIFLAALPLGGAKALPEEGRAALRALDPMTRPAPPRTVKL